MTSGSRVLDPHTRRGAPVVWPAARAAITANAAVAPPPADEAAVPAPVRGGPRAVEPWKVRWCGPCRRYEYDVGAHRGWVPLRGAPGPEVVEYLSALQPASSDPSVG